MLTNTNHRLHVALSKAFYLSTRSTLKLLPFSTFTYRYSLSSYFIRLLVNLELIMSDDDAVLRHVKIPFFINLSSPLFHQNTT